MCVRERERERERVTSVPYFPPNKICSLQRNGGWVWAQSLLVYVQLTDRHLAFSVPTTDTEAYTLSIVWRHFYFASYFNHSK